MTAGRYDALFAAVKRLVAAEAKSVKACEARRALPYGSSRARVTTANARWATAAEMRDRAIEMVEKEIRAASLGGSEARS